MAKFLIKTLIFGMFFGCTATEEPLPQDIVQEENVFDIAELGGFPAEGRTGAFSFTLDNKIYVGTGFGSNSTYFSDFWEYDLNSKIWTEKSPFPLGPYLAGVPFVYQGKGYVLAGGVLQCELDLPCEHIYYTALHTYDPISNTWQKAADLPNFKGMNVGSLEIVNDKVILFWDMKTFEIDLINYLVTEKSNPPASLTYSADFKIGNKVYFTCMAVSGKGSKSTFSYDLTSDQWETLPDFPGIKRYDAIGFSLNGYGYVLGGKESDFSGEDMQFKEIWQFNPSDNSWKKVGDYPGVAYTGQVLETVGNEVYVGFGDTRSYITFEKDWWKLVFN